MIIHYNIVGDIQDVIDRVKDTDPSYLELRVRALVITKLEEAQLWASKLWKDLPDANEP